MTDLSQTQPTETTSPSGSGDTSTSETQQTTTQTPAPTSSEGDLAEDTLTEGEGDLSADPVEGEAPKKEGEADAEDPYKDFRGPPETGEYGDYILPDGAVADPALKAEFDPIVKKLGLSQTGAQELVNFKAQLDQAQMQNWTKHLEDLTRSAKKDPEIGGLKFNENVNTARAAVSKFGDGDFKEMLRNYGVGRHPAMIKFLAKVAKATGETPALGEGGGAVSEPKPLHELMYGPAKKE